MSELQFPKNPVVGQQYDFPETAVIIPLTSVQISKILAFSATAARKAVYRDWETIG